MTTPTEDDFELLSTHIRYRKSGKAFRQAAAIETAGGMVRVRTNDDVEVYAPISGMSRVRGSWWRPGRFSFEAAGQRHRMATSFRSGPGDTSSAFFTDIGIIDLFLLIIYILLKPMMMICLVRTRCRLRHPSRRLRPARRSPSG